MATAALVAVAMLLLWQPWKRIGSLLESSGNDVARGVVDDGGARFVDEVGQPRLDPTGIPMRFDLGGDRTLRIESRMLDFTGDSLLVRHGDASDTVPVEPDGSFVIDVAPEEGEGELSILDPADESTPLATVPYLVDRQAPVLEILELPGQPVEVGGIERRFLKEPSAGFAVSVGDDRAGVRLSISGEEVSLDENGQHRGSLFTGAVTNDSQETLSLVVRDAVGNEVTRSFDFLFDSAAPGFRFRAEGETAWLAGDRSFAVPAGSPTSFEVEVAENHLAAVTVDGNDLSLEPSGDGSHRGTIPLELNAGEQRAFVFAARDHAGNTRESVLTLNLALAVTQLAMDQEALPPGGTFQTTRGSFLVEGSLNRAEDSLTLLVGDRSFPVSVQESSFRRQVDLPAIGSHRLRFEELEGEWTVDYQPPRVLEGTSDLGGEPIEFGGEVWASRIEHGATGIVFLLVPPPANRYAYGETSIELREPYYIAETETTWAQYDSLAEVEIPQGKRDHPVTKISYDEAAAFCEGVGGRLPSIAEWMHAAGGEATPTFPWGDAEPGALANVGSNGTVGVLEHAGDRSWSGLLGAGGNVSEWCSSDEGALTAGGSWVSSPEECRVDRRGTVFGGGGKNYVGFRVLLPIGASK